MERFVYRPKYAKLLIGMLGNVAHIDKLAREHDINAGHLRIVIDQWTKEGIVDKKKEGREYDLTLTIKGQKVAKKLGELMTIVRNKDTPKKLADKPADFNDGLTRSPCGCVSRPIEEAEKEDYPEGTMIIAEEICAKHQKEIDAADAKAEAEKNKTEENKK